MTKARQPVNQLSSMVMQRKYIAPTIQHFARKSERKSNEASIYDYEFIVNMKNRETS